MTAAWTGQAGSHLNATALTPEAQKGLNGIQFTGSYAWSASLLQYVPLSVDSSGNLLTSGSGGGGGGSVTQGTVPWADNIAQWGGVATSLGATVSASSVPVVIASDQSTVPVLAKTGGAALAPATASVTSTDSVVLGSNASRKGLIVINLGSVPVNFGCGFAAINNGGITLTANGTWVMDTFTFTTAAIHAICPSSSTLAIQEYQ
jgi:hypothetical protein